MDEPTIEGQVTPNPPATMPSGARTYAWWLVLGLVGLDCFSTLGYLPTLAADSEDARAAPLAAAAVSLLLLFAALPVYLYVVGRSPHGTGVTGLLGKYLSGWSGKLFILVLLGFVATDFVITRSLSTADASKHLLANESVQSGAEWMLDRKDSLHQALPELLQGEWTNWLFDRWDEQLIVTVMLTLLGFGLYFFLLRGFSSGFLYTASAIVALFLLVNGIVIVSSLVYIVHHPDYTTNWASIIGFASRDKEPIELVLDVVGLAIKSLPALALGLSGFELSMTVAPLVRGREDDDPVQPRGRIRNMRKLLFVTACLMSLLVPASVMSVTFLVPAGMMGKGGVARDRALAYLAHGGVLQPAGRRVTTDKPSKTLENQDEDDEMPPPKDENAVNPAEKAALLAALPSATGADLNPLFGSVFGTIYDLSAVLILVLAGASVTIGLRDLLPQYLTRYGMEMHWANRIGVLLHLFNAIVLIAVIAFHASVSQQQGTYTTSVLVLMAGAALAALVDLHHRWRRSFVRDLASLPFLIVGSIFFVLACWVCYDNPVGLAIALLFVVVLFVAAALSRWMRSTELRYEGFTFADEESGVRWEQIRRLDFQVLVPHRRDQGTLAEKDAEIRARHRLSPDVPIVFIEAELGDPSDFQQHPLMQIVAQDGKEVIRVSQCASIAHVLAAIALEFREVGRPPEIHFAWSDESPLASNLNFLLWGQGNIPWLVHALIRVAEPDPARQPRVVIG
jgi:hypothetical protein